jgi:thioesterase domain-containing protein
MGAEQPGSPLLPFRRTGTRPPFFCVHGAGGEADLFEPLAERLSPQQPFFGLRLVGTEARRSLARGVEQLAAHYVEAMRAVRPHGPYLIGGYSFGGVIAFAMASRLASLGEPPAVVVLVDTNSPDLIRDLLRPRPVRRVAGRALLDAKWLTWRTGAPRWTITQRVFPSARRPDWRWRVIVGKRAVRRYRPGVYDGEVVLLRTPRQASSRDLGWGSICPNLTVVDVDGAHLALFDEPSVGALATELDAVLDRASRAPVTEPG